VGHRPLSATAPSLKASYRAKVLELSWLKAIRGSNLASFCEIYCDRERESSKWLGEPSLCDLDVLSQIFSSYLIHAYSKVRTNRGLESGVIRQHHLTSKVFLQKMWLLRLQKLLMELEARFHTSN
jgi:hypothetical protein